MKKALFLAVLGVAFVTNYVMAQKTVYFVGSADPNIPRNTVYTDLLSGGLTFLNADLQEVTIQGLGYNVTFVDHLADDSSAAAGFDLIVLHESANSGDFAQYVDLPVPIFGIEQIIAAGRADRAGSLFFTFQSGVICCPEGDTSLVILDNTHPVTEIYNQGQRLVFTQNDINAQVAGIRDIDVADAARALALVDSGDAGDGNFSGAENRIILAVMEQGASGLLGDVDPPAGADPTPARRAFLGYHERVQVFDNNAADSSLISITEDGAILFQRVAQWLVGDLGGGGGTPVEDWSVY